MARCKCGTVYLPAFWPQGRCPTCGTKNPFTQEDVELRGASLELARKLNEFLANSPPIYEAKLNRMGREAIGHIFRDGRVTVTKPYPQNINGGLFYLVNIRDLEGWQDRPLVAYVEKAEKKTRWALCRMINSDTLIPLRAELFEKGEADER